MRISGFSFARNAAKLYFPIKESILSILPIVDEFVILVADSEDNTRELISSIESEKIRIIDNPWPSENTARNRVYSDLTNIALDKCTGDWCFYLQADELVHEDDLPLIRERCENLVDDRRIDGLLFDYLHFWGDYRHYHTSHGWYKKEIRIIRSGVGLRSRSDAQSFRFTDGRKATVAKSGGRIFHYGYTRPPHVMKAKTNASYLLWSGGKADIDETPEYDYGPLGRLTVFERTHPAVMKECIAQMDWQDKLREVDPPGMKRELHKDERFKYRWLSAIERFTGLDLNHKNYKRLLNI